MPNPFMHSLNVHIFKIQHKHTHTNNKHTHTHTVVYQGNGTEENVFKKRNLTMNRRFRVGFVMWAWSLKSQRAILSVTAKVNTVKVLYC